MQNSSPPSHVLELGIIGRPRGLKGALVFWPHNPESDALNHIKTVWIAQKPYTLTALNILNKGIEIRLAEIRSRDEAQALTHLALFVDQRDLPTPQEGEFYLSDLPGLQVFDTADRYLGKVHSLSHTGFQTLVHVKNGENEFCFPAEGPFINKMIAGEKIILQHIDGLLDLDKDEMP